MSRKPRNKGKNSFPKSDFFFGLILKEQNRDKKSLYKMPQFTKSK